MQEEKIVDAGNSGYPPASIPVETYEEDEPGQGRSPWIMQALGIIGLGMVSLGFFYFVLH